MHVVVVVEDDRDIAHLWRMSLEGDGADVQVAHTVEQAVAEIDWSTVDAAAIDMQLGPGASGDKLLDWLDDVHPHVRAILVTAAPPEALPEHLHDRVLWKPATLAELNAMLFGSLMVMEESEVLTRLVRLETTSEQLLTLAMETKQEAQRVAGVIDAIAGLERRHVNLESVRMQWDRIDPIIHSDPPLMTRVRSNEQTIRDLTNTVHQLTDNVNAARDWTRKLVLVVATFVLLGVLNAAIQFGGVAPMKGLTPLLDLAARLAERLSYGRLPWPAWYRRWRLR